MQFILRAGASAKTLESLADEIAKQKFFWDASELILKLKFDRKRDNSALDSATYAAVCGSRRLANSESALCQ
jgi:hypothetical protein